MGVPLIGVNPFAFHPVPRQGGIRLLWVMGGRKKFPLLEVIPGVRVFAVRVMFRGEKPVATEFEGGSGAGAFGVTGCVVQV
jgi:hypothetical protein